MRLALSVEEVIDHEIVIDIDPADHQDELVAEGIDPDDPAAFVAWVRYNSEQCDYWVADSLGDHTVNAVTEREITAATLTTAALTPSTPTRTVHFANILTGEIKGGHAGTILGRSETEVLAKLRDNFDSEGDLAHVADTNLVESMEDYYSLRITLDTQEL